MVPSTLTSDLQVTELAPFFTPSQNFSNDVESIERTTALSIVCSWYNSLIQRSPSGRNGRVIRASSSRKFVKIIDFEGTWIAEYLSVLNKQLIFRKRPENAFESFFSRVQNRARRVVLNSHDDPMSFLFKSATTVKSSD